MKHPVAIRCARNPWLATLLLVTFFARALIPAGFMPGPGGLTLCNGYASAPAGSAASDMPAMDMSGMDMSGMDMPGMDMSHRAAHPDRGGTPAGHEGMAICPFAAAAAVMASHQAEPVAVLAGIVSNSVEIPPQRFIPRCTIVPTRLPRGPPQAI